MRLPLDLDDDDGRETRTLPFLEAMGAATDLAACTPRNLETYREWLMHRYAGQTVYQSMVVLRMMFLWAERLGYIDHCPLDAHAIPDKPTSRRRPLTDDERQTLLRDGDDRLRDSYHLLAATGLRISEFCGLHADGVRFDAVVPHLHIIGKGNKVRDVPIAGIENLVRRMIATAEAAGRARLSPFGSTSAFHRAMKRDRELLGLSKEVTPHAFRHDLATYLVNETGTPLTEIRDILGHSSVRVTERYMHPDRSKGAEGIAKRAAALAESVQDRYEQEAANA